MAHLYNDDAGSDDETRAHKATADAQKWLTKAAQATDPRLASAYRLLARMTLGDR